MNQINRLEVKQLRIFQALISERSVSRVASQIGLTQQAVSEHLKKLRDIFSDELFLRKSNGLIPTPTAINLGEKVDAILQGLDKLLEPSVFDPAKIAQTYTIAATDYSQQVVLPSLLPKLRALAPNLKVVIRDIATDRLEKLMSEAKVDLIVADSDVNSELYSSITLFTDYYVCVTAKSSPLTKKKLSLEEIASEPHLMASPLKSGASGIIDGWFAKHRLRRNVVMSTPCFTTVPQYLKKTDMLAFLPNRVASDSNLAILNLKNKPIEFDVIAAWHPRSDHDALHNWVVNLLRESA
ncbi:LysR family transcriptional regulator [Microbulbifer variabilis]|uniref:LysR family transcriptional regulator n=1 Tax=Microbulbifer variabilis TaxID=266805 RepID=A0ABY4VMN1_9GAMM|nr:LysR family transcriptional regulator [Microbulbifer variabilis]USD23109.1 LysR family transcriptional regulator [Microbulbifer variabilis]